MSAIPYSGPYEAPASPSRPSVRVRVRYGSRTRQSRFRTFEYLAVFALLLSMLFGLMYFTSSLLGQTMLEDARRAGIRAKERSVQARKAAVVLRGQVDRLSSVKSIEAWATSRGLLSPIGSAQTLGKNLVASRH